jgi:hypothetical protein
MNGKILIFNRRNFNSVGNEEFKKDENIKFNLMDTFNALEFVSNNYQETKRKEGLDFFYGKSQNILVQNIDMVLNLHKKQLIHIQ